MSDEAARAYQEIMLRRRTLEPGPGEFDRLQHLSRPQAKAHSRHRARPRLRARAAILLIAAILVPAVAIGVGVMFH